MEAVVLVQAAGEGQNLQIWFAFFAAIFGGAGLKLIETLLNKGKIKQDVAQQIRTELREEITGLRTELKHVEEELDKWKAKYYELLTQFIKTTGGNIELDELNEKKPDE